MNSTLISTIKRVKHDQEMSITHSIFLHRFIHDLMNNMVVYPPQVHIIVHQDNSNPAFYCVLT